MEVVFEMFGEFEKDQHDVLFDVSCWAYQKKIDLTQLLRESLIFTYKYFKISLQDDAEKFVDENKGIDVVAYRKIRCLSWTYWNS